MFLSFVRFYSGLFRLFFLDRTIAKPLKPGLVLRIHGLYGDSVQGQEFH